MLMMVQSKQIKHRRVYNMIWVDVKGEYVLLRDWKLALRLLQNAVKPRAGWKREKKTHDKVGNYLFMGRLVGGY